MSFSWRTLNILAYLPSIVSLRKTSYYHLLHNCTNGVESSVEKQIMTGLFTFFSHFYLAILLQYFMSWILLSSNIISYLLLKPVMSAVLFSSHLADYRDRDRILQGLSLLVLAVSVYIYSAFSLMRVLST